MLIALTAALLFWGALLLGVLIDAPVPPVPLLPAPADAPKVAAIVPARNEAHQIERGLRSLLAQQWPRLSVICVDDRSEDRTFEVASSIADPRLLVVRGSELPPGWLGKNWGNTQGVLQARGAEWLLFTDADTFHQPQALPSAYAAAVRCNASLYTLFTELECHTFWEKLLLRAVIASIVQFFPARKVNDPRSKVAVANGQFLLMPRAAYEALGGHAAIKDRVADDLELAKLAKGSGRVLRAENGRALVSVRMYTSLREIWWGFAKNAAAGAGGVWVASLGVLLSLFGLLPFLVLPFARGTALAVAASACACALLQRALLLRRLFGASALWALFVPVTNLFLAGVAAHSVLRQLRGQGPLWKGRAYPNAR